MKYWFAVVIAALTIVFASPVFAHSELDKCEPSVGHGFSKVTEVGAKPTVAPLADGHRNIGGLQPGSSIPTAPPIRQ